MKTSKFSMLGLHAKPLSREQMKHVTGGATGGSFVSAKCYKCCPTDACAPKPHPCPLSGCGPIHD